MARAERKKQESVKREPGFVVAAKRKNLEFARVHVMNQIEHALVDAHRDMLRRALAAVEQQLKKLA